MKCEEHEKFIHDCMNKLTTINMKFWDDTPKSEIEKDVKELIKMMRNFNEIKCKEDIIPNKV